MMTDAQKNVPARLQPFSRYKARSGESYCLMPFRFLPLDAPRYLLTNFAGEYVVLAQHLLRAFIRHELPLHSETYDTLKVKHFLLDGDSTVPVDLLAAKYRTKQAFLSQFTSLFMFVTTLRCNHACTYCQVSACTERAADRDMHSKVAEAAVEFMFRSPSTAIKVEFQGGESLLNMPALKHIVELALARNEAIGRELEFVIATNLSGLTADALDFFREHRVHVSTSLDGPRALHNRNRPRFTGDSYAEVTEGIQRVKAAMGPDSVSALMTTTRASLCQPREIVDEYLRQGLSSIFLRSLNPYGRAVSSDVPDKYTMAEWLAFYREALAYILDQNRQGTALREEYTAMLRKMLTPYASGYVDLQSPAGIGIGGIVVNYDGNVYCSDESRMLAEMGDRKFLMGNVLRDSYEEIMLSDTLLEPLTTTMTECVPQCSDCGIQPYCGSDPVRHYKTQHDLVGFKPSSDFCQKHLGVVKHLVHLLEDDEAAASILRTWI